MPVGLSPAAALTIESKLAAISISYRIMSISASGTVMYESVCKLVGREGEGKKWLSDLAEERRYRGG